MDKQNHMQSHDTDTIGAQLRPTFPQVLQEGTHIHYYIVNDSTQSALQGRATVPTIQIGLHKSQS